MYQNRTLSILQRVSAILAVTAASYGLQVQAAPRPTSHLVGGPGATKGALDTVRHDHGRLHWQGHGFASLLHTEASSSTSVDQ